jgi:hypothetical protein
MGVMTVQSFARVTNGAFQVAAGLLLCGARTEAALAMGHNAAVELLHMPEVRNGKRERERERKSVCVWERDDGRWWERGR